MCVISAVVSLARFDFRLKEIQMSKYDAQTYERFSGAVRRQVHALRIILDNLQVIPPLMDQENNLGPEPDPSQNDWKKLSES